MGLAYGPTLDCTFKFLYSSNAMNDKWFRILGIPVIAGLMHLLYTTLPLAFTRSWLVGYGIGLVYTATIWEGNRAIFLFMRRCFPRYDQTLRRLLVQTAASTVFTYLATFAITKGFELWLGRAVCPADGYWLKATFNLLPTLVVTSFYESAYFFGEWKRNLQRSEALARAGIQGELEALQRQLDPHFLFNSLNTLAAIIEPENEAAQQFVEQLADVYRYVLLSRDRPTVPLAEELKFVEAYVALHKMRFRDDLLVEQRIAPGASEHTVAPLSVQMLIENALKHNAVSPQSPLCVTLRAEGGAAGYVSVANNIQPKTSLAKPTQVGLRNIIERYRLLTTAPVEVRRANGQFTVRLPLLAAE